MWKGGLLAFGLILHATSEACSCLAPKFTDKIALESQHVFVFRLLSAELMVDSPSKLSAGYSTRGRIRVVECLKGTGSQFLEVTFNTSECCGTRLDVGHYYLAFVNSNESSFIGSGENVANINGSYQEADPEVWREERVLGRIKLMLNGRLVPEEAVRPSYFSWVTQSPPPPPEPCPEAQ